MTWSVLVHLFVAYLDLPLLIVLAVVTVLIGFDAEQRRQLFDRVSVSLLAVWFVLPIVVFSGATGLLGVTLLFDRYVLFILPAGLLVAAGLAGVGRRGGWRRLAPFAALLTFSLAWNLIPSVQRTGGFGDRYDEAFPHKEGQLAAGAWLAASLGPGGRVLDLGCGTGLPTARQLTDAGLRVTGVDLSAGMLALARENVPEAASTPPGLLTR